MTEPAAVRLDDLAAPRFSPEAAAMLDAMAELAPTCVIEPEALRETAAASAELDHFGDERFAEPLEVLTRALRTEANLSAPGVVSMHTQLVQLLVNRLRIVDLVHRHPEILDVQVVTPIVIVGLPRTGTTHLHNLLAADPRLRTLPYWESVEPVLADGEQPASGEDDPRLARTAAAVEFLDVAMPHFKRMHEMTVDHVHEEIQLLAIDFSTMYFETLTVMPSYRDWYGSIDQGPTYTFLRLCLQVLTWLHGGTRWVLKSPQHLEQFGPLLATFPEATFVVTHRDPVEVTTSLATMIAYTARLQVAKPEPARIGAYWASRVGDLLTACTRDRDLLPPEQSLDVRFADFMTDEVGTVQRVYDVAGMAFDSTARAATTEYLANHRRNRYGRVEYDPALVGIDPDARRADLAAYAERFNV